MMLGARTAAWAKRGGGWVNPYVTDGLVAMWDGEWNAGGGVHNPNSSVWKDLSGNGYDIQSSIFAWSLKSLNVTTTSNIDLPEALKDRIKSFYRSSGISFYCVFDITFPEYGYGVFDMRTDGSDGTWSVRSDNQKNTTSQIMYWTPRAGNRRYSLGPSSKSYNNNIVAITSSLSSSNVYIGNVLIGSGQGTASSYVGEITSIRLVTSKTIPIRRFMIYDKSLTKDEIAANYAIDKARFNLP